MDDLGYLFGKIYAWTPKSEGDISHFMLRVLDELYSEKHLTFENGAYMRCFSSFMGEIRKDMKLYDVSFDMAVILEVMSILSKLSREEIKLIPPHYGKKEHFRLGCLLGKYPISMTYAEMNRRAQEAFKR